MHPFLSSASSSGDGLSPGPVLAIEVRNGRAQAVHTGHAVLLDGDGRVARSWGDPLTATYWRSAAKPFQALPFVAFGALDAFGLGPEELAVACGSHAAEPFHLEAVGRILASAGVPEGALRCGVHDPGPQAGPQPPSGWRALHNNCSGKHAAMLATCRRRGWPLEGYLEPGHPIQQEILAWVARAAGRRPEEVPFGVDGCGVPTFFLPILDLARSFRWVAAGGEEVARRVLQAMASHSRMVGGTGQLDTDLAIATGGATGGSVVGKYGALGVYGAVHRRTGAALAVKMAAGNTPPAKAVAVAVMQEAGWLDAAARRALENHLRPALRNHAGLEVGRLEPRLG